MRRSSSPWLVVALSLVSPTFEAHAERPTPAAQAKAASLAGEAQAAFDEGEFALALQFFQRADALVHSLDTSLGIARSQVGLGKTTEALATYDALLNEGPPVDATTALRAQYAGVRKERDALAARLGLPPSAPPASASARPTSAPPTSPPSTATSAAQPPPTPPKPAPPTSSSQPTRPDASAPSNAPLGASNTSGPSPSTLVLGAWVLGGVALATGLGTGVYSLSRASSLEETCPDRRCPSTEADRVSTYDTIRTVSTVTTIGGVTLLAAGTVMHFVIGRAPDEKTGRARPRPLGLGFGPGTASLYGTFLPHGSTDATPCFSRPPGRDRHAHYAPRVLPRPRFRRRRPATAGEHFERLDTRLFRSRTTDGAMFELRPRPQDKLQSRQQRRLPQRQFL